MTIPIQHADDVPEWIRAYACDVRDLFGLSEWKLWVELSDTPGGKSHIDGNCNLDTRYLKAVISVRRGLTSKERIQAVVMHEMGHVLLARIDQCMDRLMDMIPDEQRVHAQQLYADAEESTLERLTRALQVGIQSKVKVE